MTDPTSEDSTPTTNEELGVVGAQLAAAERQTNGNTPGTATPQLGVEATLAVEALRLADRGTETPQAVVERAAAYYEFLKEKTNG